MAEEFHAGICGETWWNWNPTKIMFTGCNSSLNSDHNDGSIDSTLQMMGFGLPSGWNQTLLSNGRSDQCYNNPIVGGDISEDCSIMKPVNQDFSTTSYECASTLLQSLFEDDYDQPPQEESTFNNYMAPLTTGGDLHLNNNTSFWNSSATDVNDVKSGFLLSPLEEKPNGSAQTYVERVGKSESIMKAPLKRPRLETPSPLPTFKVRKEKLGDRITALQQLVSPFGKTDTASVLQEAIEYINFLHDQVLSTPYMKQTAASIQQQIIDEMKDQDGPKQDLRSRGLCLVPVLSTFPLANETPADFWTPTFGGTFK